MAQTPKIPDSWLVSAVSLPSLLFLALSVVKALPAFVKVLQAVECFSSASVFGQYSSLRSICQALRGFEHQPGYQAIYQDLNSSARPVSGESSSSDEMDAAAELRKSKKKKKVLLMGKSGSGKSSMRSIIFSNYIAKDTRRLGATIDVEHSHVRFLGNLTLNLWDCGGQDAFVEHYLNTQREHVFSNVGVLIYVFDIETRDFNRDVVTFSAIVRALKSFSPNASIFCLIHKMDLVQTHFRTKLYDDRVSLVQERSEGMRVTCFPTSIWDQSLFKAWSSIIYTLVPNLDTIEQHLKLLANAINAEEIVLFERTTFLVVTSVTSEIGAMNPTKDRFERLSSIIKTFKQSLSKYTGLPRSSNQFVMMRLSQPTFNFFIARFTQTTYVAVATPPGESTYNGAVLNTQIAREHFEKMENLGLGGASAAAASTEASRGDSSGAGEGASGSKDGQKGDSVRKVRESTARTDDTDDTTKATEGPEGSK
ncbi:MAG: hypothetical protein M1825_001798 [Sarcosagium campestre]|nr:MAG: hypothetical protein M1825_001798 [Sarcosagium campestre]